MWWWNPVAATRTKADSEPRFAMDIRITGASQNTLRHISLTLPAGKMIALMGPSGSGKSTLA